ncbi:PSP1 domain-containing protein [Macrococcus armenti]|uniref:PSP1 domain-containing protein n=1 Tax=Macrococcus armenti TaxID=2875764 RepID=UPI001CCE0597|nr:stage 0 sporulation family protein [Macrococcus armenti]UBH13086.1 stage 0 sporulation family protein [Macrococcus armenti]UBH22321.1 stage 0 sporulation family protein [Macrococcus armenti]
MIEVIGVKFQKAGRTEYYSPGKEQFYRNEFVVINHKKRGMELARVIIPNKTVNDDEVVTPVPAIHRRATEEDLIKYEQNMIDADKALEICKKHIHNHELDMRLVNAQYTLDKGKIIFNFTASERVDFRELVKSLAFDLKTRIELRQIGVRDEAKILGGIGPCGRSLCCATYLGDFEPVSIKMAKDQNLSLNPTKISGACGRLMCCLKYENDYYEETRKKLPDIGTMIDTPHGKGKVIGLNILDVTMQVKVPEMEAPIEFHIDEIEI